MKTTFLDFEQPIAELEAKIEELRFVQDDSAVDISEEIARLEQKNYGLTKDIYAKLTPWQCALVARHPQRPYTLDYVEHIFTDFEELHGDRSFAEYLDRAEREPEEWETFVNSLTTNLTSFFREAHHFDILAERLKKHVGRTPVRIWCSAASTGEEPYSIVMTALEALAPRTHFKLAASDIDSTSLRSPVAWLGSMTMGRWLRCLMMGTTLRSSVLRV